MKQKTVCIVGRVNVGKSTLFNRLTRSWDAIVEDTPGVTRDRKEGIIKIRNHAVKLIDTGGIDPDVCDEPAMAAQEQSIFGLNSADLIIFMVDARAGTMPGDFEIAQLIRRSQKKTILIANKAESPRVEHELYEFTKLGFNEPLPVSAEHKINYEVLLDLIFEKLGLSELEDSDSEEETFENEISVAIVGRPNVGKSSLINTLIGEEKHIVTSIPGTTRDSIDSIYTYYGRKFRIIDTAGLKRIGKTKNRIDKVASMLARKSIERAHIGVMMIDASVGITAQDATIAGYIFETGRGCLIVANKWDITPKTKEFYDKLKEDIAYKFKFMDWAPLLTVSAISSQRVTKIFEQILKIADNLGQKIPTTQLNKVIQEAQRIHPPPRRKQGRPVKFYYATQVKNLPPTFMIFTNTHEKIHFSYERFLINFIRKSFNLEGCPIRLVFKHKRDSLK